jgi:hypothetical protein
MISFFLVRPIFFVRNLDSYRSPSRFWITLKYSAFFMSVIGLLVLILKQYIEIPTSFLNVTELFCYLAGLVVIGWFLNQDRHNWRKDNMIRTNR